MPYSDYDYLCNESIFLDGIGDIKCPTLRDIRKVTYSLFCIYVKFLTVSKEEFLKLNNLLEKHNQLDEEQKEYNSIFRLLCVFAPEILQDLVQYFSKSGTVSLDAEEMTIKIYDTDKTVIGIIDNSNFEYYRKSVATILGISTSETKKTKYKSERARLLCEKIEKNRQKKNNPDDLNYALSNMVLKYCTYNTSGINMLNIWDLTYYQFIKLFCELVAAKEFSYINSIASNTFSFTDENAKSFDSSAWINKLN